MFLFPAVRQSVFVVVLHLDRAFLEEFFDFAKRHDAAVDAGFLDIHRDAAGAASGGAVPFTEEDFGIAGQPAGWLGGFVIPKLLGVAVAGNGYGPVDHLVGDDKLYQFVHLLLHEPGIKILGAVKTGTA